MWLKVDALVLPLELATTVMAINQAYLVSVSIQIRVHSTKHNEKRPPSYSMCAVTSKLVASVWAGFASGRGNK